jgi:hypothetical protein
MQRINIEHNQTVVGSLHIYIIKKNEQGAVGLPCFFSLQICLCMCCVFVDFVQFFFFFLSSASFPFFSPFRFMVYDPSDPTTSCLRFRLLVCVCVCVCRGVV